MSTTSGRMPDVPGPTLDNPDERGPGTTADGVRIPQRLLDDYDIVGLLEKQHTGLSTGQGPRALLVRARRRTDQLDVVLKLVGSGIEHRNDVLTAIQGQQYPHLVTLHGFGTTDGIGYEVLEYVPAGDLTDLLRRAGGRLSPDHVVRVVTEMTQAIDAMHHLGHPAALTHGDIKPTNVLVRDGEPLDLVLSDFGLSTLKPPDLDDQVRATPRWSSPNTASAIVEPEGDWWSLGVLVYWCLTGREPLSELSDETAVEALRDHQVPLDDLPDDERDWRLLCQGLLTRDKNDRWGREQVTAWVAGDAPPLGPEWLPAAVPVEVMVAAGEPAPPAIRFAGQSYSTTDELAIALVRHWDDAVALLHDPTGAQHLAASIHAHAEHQHDLDATRAAQLAVQPGDPEARLVRLVTTLSARVPPTFRGVLVDRPSLRDLADAASSTDRADEAARLESLRLRALLPLWDPSETGDGLTALQSQWDEQVNDLDEHLTAGGIDLTERQRDQAHARILLALLDDDERRRLRRSISARRVHRLRRWPPLDEALAEAPQHEGAAVAAVLLVPSAQAHRAEADAEQSAARQAAREERYRAGQVRYPRTAQMLAWSLVPLVALSVASVYLWLLPLWVEPYLPAETLLAWLREQNPLIRRWAAVSTQPAVVLPLLALTLVLLGRARGAGSFDGPLRHPAERRTMQGLVAASAALFPPMLPIVGVSWARGMQQLAPEGTGGRNILRGLTMLFGFVSLMLGMLIATRVSQVWVYEVLRLEVFEQTYDWGPELLSQDLVVTAPADFALGLVPGGIGAITVWPMAGAVLALTALSLSIGALAYQRRSRWMVPLLVVTTAVVALGTLNLGLGYLFLGRSAWLDALLAAPLAFGIWRILAQRRPTT